MQFPDYCKYCQTSVSSDHWYWQKSKQCRVGGYWRCKQANRNNVRRWRKDSLAQSRLTSYVQADLKRGFECTISLEEIAALIIKSCYYCGNNPSNGLDRMNSGRGHVCGNVVPCCEKCNNILSDLPFDAKEKLKAGLHQIQQENLLAEWEIPTKRKQ